jgi:hypothetical protein
MTELESLIALNMLPSLTALKFKRLLERFG